MRKSRRKEMGQIKEISRQEERKKLKNMEEEKNPLNLNPPVSNVRM